MTINFQAEDGLHIEVIVHGKATSSLSPGAAEQIHAELGRAIEKAAELRKIEEEAHREKFSLELGVDLNGERVCALEAGTFDTSAHAVSFAMAVRGRLTKDVAALEKSEWYDLTSGDADDLPIVGASLNIHTDARGTLRDVILY